MSQRLSVIASAALVVGVAVVVWLVIGLVSSGGIRPGDTVTISATVPGHLHREGSWFVAKTEADYERVFKAVGDDDVDVVVDAGLNGRIAMSQSPLFARFIRHAPPYIQCEVEQAMLGPGTRGRFVGYIRADHVVMSKAAK